MTVSTRFTALAAVIGVMGGLMLTHNSLAKEVKVEHPPYPATGLKRLVKPERLPRTDYPVIEQGAQIWDKSCKICHGTGNFGAPKITGSKFWSPRIEQGIDVLIAHATEGFLSPSGGSMPARGGNKKLTDEEVAAAVRFMVYHSGGQEEAIKGLD